VRRSIKKRLPGFLWAESEAFAGGKNGGVDGFPVREATEWWLDGDDPAVHGFGYGPGDWAPAERCVQLES
jgi:hypothetical protein